MSKKNAVILILLIFLLILGGLLFFYFYNGKNQTTTPPPTGNTPSNPFGTNTTNRTGASTTNERNYTYPGTNKKVATLRQLYAYPNSGAVLLEKSGVTFARFVDRATGNIHEVASDSEEIKRITNTTVPKILEAIWSSTGNSLVLRYSVNDPQKLDNFSAKIKTATSTSNEFTGEITGKVVAQNAMNININPSGNKLFTLSKTKGIGGTYGVISNLDEASSKQVFSSDISEWLTSWPKDNMISFVTKPSFKQYGYLFFLNVDNGSFEKILGNIYGLNALVNKEATAFVYSSTARGSVRLNYFDIKTGMDKNLQLTTLADKCVWSNKDKSVVYCAVPKYITNSNYPDTWYQGITSFSDNFWKINTEQGTTELVYQTGIDESINVDAMELKINEDDSFLVFTDKNNLSLWGLQIGAR